MGFFFTEERIEALLEQETRTVSGPTGARVSITAFKALWKAYDFLVFLGIHTPERIIELAIRNSEQMGISFERSFAAVIWNANDQARAVLGFDCFAIRPAH